MPRRRQHVPLRVHLNSRLVGHLRMEPGGTISFHYDDSWLGWPNAIPVSLSLPLREDGYRGTAVNAVFENLLPDSEMRRRRIAENVGAEGADTHSLLAAIGQDCVGALQFIPGDADAPDATMESTTIDEAGIEKLLRTLGRAPLGLSQDDAFRISIAGAQEKTALLWDGTRWRKPLGTTPTTHILKPQIGELSNGINMSNSVENEFYCLRLMAAFGLPVNDAVVVTFGKISALAIERFDRLWTHDGRLLRLPQEDCCQALSVPPRRKYQSDGGPGLVQVLDLLKGSDTRDEDQRTVLKAQILFWLIGATDGHAKNFSVFLGPGGSYRLTPLYDVLSVQPSADARQTERKNMRLAMAVGTTNHHRIDGILGRHFLETGRAAGLSNVMVQSVIEEVAQSAHGVMERLADELPPRFPKSIHTSVRKAVVTRLRILSTGA